MTITTKLALSILIAAGIVMVVRHGANALRPAMPPDMPQGSYFVQSGYDVRSNEPTGNWIACRADPDQNADFCRVTDAHGNVIYQGEFMPVNGTGPVPQEQLKFAIAQENKIWVDGPAEAAPVPVIPLTNGEILVPADDTYALGYRWSNNPDELHRVKGD